MILPTDENQSSFVKGTKITHEKQSNNILPLFIVQGVHAKESVNNWGSHMGIGI